MTFHGQKRWRRAQSENPPPPPSTTHVPPLLYRRPTPQFRSLGNKAFENLQYELPNYEMYDIVWGSSIAAGNLAAQFANPHLGRDVETPTCDDKEFKDDVTINTAPQLGDKRPGTSNRLPNKRNKGKGRISYEDSIIVMTNAYVVRQELIVTSKESRQSRRTTAAIFIQWSILSRRCPSLI